MSANDRQEGGDHYRRSSYQPWDFIDVHHFGWMEGNAIKYVSRWRKKNGVPDLEKALHYMDKLIELAQTEGRGPHTAVDLNDLEKYIVANQLNALERTAVTQLSYEWTIANLGAARNAIQMLIDGAYHCKDHPTYKAMRAPTADCEQCRIIWAEAARSIE